MDRKSVGYTEIETLVESALKNNRALENWQKNTAYPSQRRRKEAIDADIESLILEQGGKGF